MVDSRLDRIKALVQEREALEARLKETADAGAVRSTIADLQVERINQSDLQARLQEVENEIAMLRMKMGGLSLFGGYAEFTTPC